MNIIGYIIGIIGILMTIIFSGKYGREKKKRNKLQNISQEINTKGKIVQQNIKNININLFDPAKVEEMKKFIEYAVTTTGASISVSSLDDVMKEEGEADR